MKTIDDIEYLVARNELTAMQVFTAMRQHIEIARHVQDKDTRHACVSALESCDMMDDKWISFDAAEEAIMNTKAI